MNERILSAIIQSKVPTLLWSDPGMGKTAWLEALGKALGLPVHIEIASQADPTDLGGYPREDGGVILRKPLKWLSDACDRATMIFFDEITLSPRSVLAGLLSITNERRACGRYLHADTLICAAANPPEFTGVELLPQTANRYSHVDFESIIPLSSWCEGMVAGFPTPTITKLPETWESLIPQNRATISSFISRMSTEAFRKPKEQGTLGKAWPSRRTWDLASKVSAACQSIGEEDAMAIASLVGKGPALAYVSWRAAQDLGNPDEALANPKTYKLPNEDDKLYILLSSIAAIAVSKKDKAVWSNAWALIGRVCQAQKADVAAVAGKVLAGQMPAGASIPKEAAALLPILRASGV